MKKLISTLAMAAILATFTFTYNTQEAKAQLPRANACKWLAVTCQNGSWFGSGTNTAVCVGGGNGNECSCGSMTFPCY